MREAWNEEWKFTRDFHFGFEEAIDVRLPHCVKEISYNYCQEEDYQLICGYEKKFKWRSEWEGKRVFITFDGAAHEASVYLNGTLLGTHSCGYTAFTYELTDKLIKDENRLTVRLDTREVLDQPPFGYMIDYLTYGGIYREVWLDVREKSFIADAYVTTKPEAPKLDSWRSSFWITIGGKVSSGLKLELTLYDAENVKVGYQLWELSQLIQSAQKIPSCLMVSPLECRSYLVEQKTLSPKLWKLSSPTLYKAVIELIRGDEHIDMKEIRFGFCTREFREEGFFLNGRKIRLRGLNRHQSYPYIGYAATKSLQYHDAKVLKEELGVNAVRTSHYPQSQHFIDACDSLGLLVFTEIPGWQHIGGEKWKDRAVRNVEEMVVQYRNHPSIFLWGVRINESVDDDEFYKRTNETAHSLDKTRPTSGVRYLEKSHLLEDVYAYNDFSYSGGKKSGVKKKKDITPDMGKPYFISEYNGHMYPCKMWDPEENRLEHALRHARVLSSMYQEEDICGCFGWCMADYNTHKDFGSGDKICYHGVTDMFRNPKMAAYVYASQSDKRPVLALSSTMDIGEHPAGNLGDIYAFTNADSVRLYKNGEFVNEFFPDRKEFSLAHPPILIDDLIGGLLEKEEKMDSELAAQVKDCLNAIRKYGQESLPVIYKAKLGNLMLRHGFKMEDGVRLYGKYVGNWGIGSVSYRIEGVWNGQVLKSVETVPGRKVHLETETDHFVLKEEDTYDMAIVKIRARDEQGNELPYYQEPVCLEVSGKIELVGPSVISLKGGAAGVLIRSRGQMKDGETAELVIKGNDVENVRVKFKGVN